MRPRPPPAAMAFSVFPLCVGVAVKLTDAERALMEEACQLQTVTLPSDKRLQPIAASPTLRLTTGLRTESCLFIPPLDARI